jgi:multidrug efflux pump subunit AcrA (membrane-fusion protein)
MVMRAAATPRHPRRGPLLGLLAAAAAVAVAAPGCGHEEASRYQSVAKPPTVQLIQPTPRTIVRTVGQPSFIEAYERTSIYPKLAGFIEKWNVDIGDKVKKNEVLTKLFIPELDEDYVTKDATVKLDERRVEFAKKVVEVATADVKAAEAALAEAKAILDKYESEVDRWNTEVKRLDHEVKRGVVDPQILLESTNQWRSASAARDAAKATIAKAEAELLSRQAALAKAEVDVSVKEADLAVARSDWKRVGALVGYITLPAPYDGIVEERNANTGDFVLPNAGDPTANQRSPHLSNQGAAPVYVVDRTDIVRIFIDIPEADANYVRGCDLILMPSVKEVKELPKSGRDLIVLARVGGKVHARIFDSDGQRTVDTDETHLADRTQQVAALKSFLEGKWEERPISPIDKEKVVTALTGIFGRDRVPVGTKATVLARGYRDEPIPGTVTRTSWALNVKSRTLRAEIDLANPNSQLLPGMYAYAKVMIERRRVPAVPVTALTHSGDQTFCWVYKDGKALRTEVRTGISDGDWIEVTNLLRPDAPKNEDPWTPVTGSEKLILGDLSILAEGGAVRVASSPEETKVASARSGEPGTHSEKQ